MASNGSQSFEDKDWASQRHQTPSDFSTILFEMPQPVQDPKNPKRKASWRFLFAFATPQHTGPLASAVVASVLAGLIRPTSAIIFGQLFNALTDYGLHAIDAKEMLHRVSRWCLALTALGAATWIVEWLFFWMWMVVGELQAKSVRQKLFAGMLEKNVEWYDLREDGIAPLLSRIETQIRELQLAISQPLGFLFLELMALVASIGTALYFSWRLALVILATFPIAAGVLAVVSRGVGLAIERQKRELSRASKYANTAVNSINTVKAFNGESQEVWQYFLISRAITEYYLIQARSNALQFGVIKFSAVALFVSGFWYGLHLVTSGLSVAHVLTTFVSCSYAMQAVEIVLPQFLVLAKGISAGETLKSIMAEMQEGRSTSDEDGKLIPSACPGDIEINNVTFAYPTNPHLKVLSNATFFFPTGETTFLVGKSGSGKSTIASLLMKFYQVQSGEIMVDNQSIQSLNTEWLRQNVTLVQQQSIVFNDTLFQNIAFGSREPTTRYQIRLAARDTGLERAVDEMPGGFDTLVGPNNRTLSGGQEQRVGIARARLRNAPILILDESTSALDQTSRMEVMDRIRKWRKGKTTIIITHDLSQVLDNDYVYVLQNAKVVREGYFRALAGKSFEFFAQVPQVSKLGDFPSSLPSRSPADHDIPPSDQFGTLDAHALESHYPWNSISTKVASHNTLSANRNEFIDPPRTRVSLGPAMLARTNALLAEEHWFSPVIPDSPTQSCPQKSFMAFMSPRASPQRPVSAFSFSRHNSHLSGTPTFGSHNGSSRRTSRMFQNEHVMELDNYVQSKAKAEHLLDVEDDTSFDHKPSSLRTIFGSVLPALTWRDRLFLSCGVLASVIVGAATPIFTWVFSQLLQTFYVVENRKILAEKWALCMLGIAMVDGCSCYCSHYFLEKSAQAWINSLRIESLRRILSQSKSWFDLERNAPSRLTDCLDRDAEEMRNLLGRFVGLAITIFTMLFITTIWAFAVEWKLTLVALASAPVMYLFTWLYNRSSAKWESRGDQACALISSIFTETFHNIKVVRALTLENHFLQKHGSAIAAGYRLGKTRAAVSGCLFGFVDSPIFYIVALVFYYGAIMISSSDTSVTRIFVVVNLLILGTGNAIGMFAMIPQLNSSRTTATQVLRLVNLSCDRSHESRGTRRLADPFPIKLDNLSFTYPSRPHIKTLDNVSLTITAGSCTALVGPSGSGKSTIASILIGLYPPDSLPGLYSPSPLTFAGKSSHDCNIHNIRTHMSIVPQTPLLFPVSIFANIAYGLPDSSPYKNSVDVENAAIDAGIHDFISSLEKGYLTLIGEGGMGLSGGQAQRIVIARALVRRPKVLILDEATSALDAESADGIRHTVTRLRKKQGMAVLIITHNVDMMRIADLVVMIEDGRVVEGGGFEELRKKGGAFESLITGHGRRPRVEMEGFGLGNDSYVEG